ncbi:hypothetical protein SALBM217S_06413 [Streptomyces griseoloalbus]
MAAAVLLSGGARLRTAQATVAAAVALTLVGVVGQSRDVPEDITEARVRASVTPEQLHTCVERDATTYCAFPEWAPRTDDWARAVDDVRALAGGDAQDRPLAVRQRVEARYGLDTDTILAPLTRPGEVTVGTTWGGNRVPEFTIAVAGVLVTGSEASMGELCDGRMVTVDVAGPRRPSRPGRRPAPGAHRRQRHRLGDRRPADGAAPHDRRPPNCCANCWRCRARRPRRR